MADFMKKVTKLALKSAAVCAGVAASAALLHKYVKIQSNCSECGPSEDDFDEDRNEDDTTKNVDEAANTASEEESDAISSDEATDSSSRRYINIHVTGKNSDVDINIDKGQLLDDAAKLVADAAHLTKICVQVLTVTRRLMKTNVKKLQKNKQKTMILIFILNT